MKKLFARAAASLSGRYRTMSIQMVISLSFTAAAVAGMVLMGLSLVWRYSAGTEQLVRENTERVLGQVNMNMDSYLRRMMRVSDTMYYRIIKNADLATQSLNEGMELLYEENRDELVSIAVFDSKGALVAVLPGAAVEDGDVVAVFGGSGLLFRRVFVTSEGYDLRAERRELAEDMHVAAADWAALYYGKAVWAFQPLWAG